MRAEEGSGAAFPGRWRKQWLIISCSLILASPPPEILTFSQRERVYICVCVCYSTWCVCVIPNTIQQIQQYFQNHVRDHLALIFRWLNNVECFGVEPRGCGICSTKLILSNLLTQRALFSCLFTHTPFHNLELSRTPRCTLEDRALGCQRLGCRVFWQCRFSRRSSTAAVHRKLPSTSVVRFFFTS